MKILLFHTTPIDRPCANVIQILEMSQAFVSCGHDVVLYIPKIDRAADKHQCIRTVLGMHSTIRIHTYQPRALWGHLKFVKSIFAFIKAVSLYPGYVIYTRDLVVFALFGRKRQSWIYESHRIYHFRSCFKRWAVGLLENMVRKHANQKHLLKFVCISNALADSWKQKGVVPSKIVVSHDGVDIARYETDEHCPVIKSFRGNGYDKIVLYCGSLKEDRNIEYIYTLAKHFQDVGFVVVGGSPSQVQDCQRKASQMKKNNILFLGYVAHHEIPVYLKRSDILLMLWSQKIPTLQYCSPLKVFEYLAAEKVILGSNIPTLGEILENQTHAILVCPDDVDALKDGLSNILSGNFDSQMPARAKELASEFTWENRVRTIMKGING